MGIRIRIIILLNSNPGSEPFKCPAVEFKCSVFRCAEPEVALVVFIHRNQINFFQSIFNRVVGLPELFSALAELCPVHEVAAARLQIRRIALSATFFDFD
jgi:hypothetical protein